MGFNPTTVPVLARRLNSGALFGLVANAYDALGEEVVKAFFPCDKTHTGWAGARFNADVVATRVRDLEGCGLSDYLALERH